MDPMRVPTRPSQNFKRWASAHPVGIDLASFTKQITVGNYIGILGGRVAEDELRRRYYSDAVGEGFGVRLAHHGVKPLGNACPVTPHRSRPRQLQDLISVGAAG